MLSTYQRLLDMAKITRTGTVTYDNRSQDELIRQLMAEVDVLKARVRELQSERPEEAASVSSQADEVRNHA